MSPATATTGIGKRRTIHPTSPQSIQEVDRTIGQLFEYKVYETIYYCIGGKLIIVGWLTICCVIVPRWTCAKERMGTVGKRGHDKATQARWDQAPPHGSYVRKQLTILAWETRRRYLFSRHATVLAEGAVQFMNVAAIQYKAKKRHLRVAYTSSALTTMW